VSVSHEVVECPPHKSAEINLLVDVVIAVVQEISVVVHKSHLAFVADEMCAVETPAVPSVERLFRFSFGDVWFLVFLHPRPMAAGRTYYHLLIFSDEAVV
jgi:hypothetical protein